MVVIIEGGDLSVSVSDVVPFKGIVVSAQLSRKDKIVQLKAQHGLSRNEAYAVLEAVQSIFDN